MTAPKILRCSLAIKGVGGEQFDGARDGIALHEHGAESTLFGFKRLRRYALARG
jgi:hypothetical protein